MKTEKYFIIAMRFFLIPGQGSTAQRSMLILAPSQCLPPLMDCSSTVLFLCLRPPPHVLEQDPNSLQLFHIQSTVKYIHNLVESR